MSEADKARRKMHRRAFWWGFFHPFVGRECQLEHAKKLTTEFLAAYPEALETRKGVEDGMGEHWCFEHCSICNVKPVESPEQPSMSTGDAADLLARFLEAKSWSMFTSDDPEIIRLRGIENRVYAEHRDKDFTRARIESMKAVILDVFGG